MKVYIWLDEELSMWFATFVREDVEKTTYLQEGSEHPIDLVDKAVSLAPKEFVEMIPDFYKLVFRLTVDLLFEKPPSEHAFDRAPSHS
jgi:hypothetical protein